MKTIEINRAVAGDIISFAGFTNTTITHTINKVGKSEVIKAIKIDPPIISIEVDVNTSPLAGKESEATKFTKSEIKKRLAQEADNDVALTIKGIESKDPHSQIIL